MNNQNGLFLKHLDGCTLLSLDTQSLPNVYRRYTLKMQFVSRKGSTTNTCLFHLFHLYHPCLCLCPFL